MAYLTGVHHRFASWQQTYTQIYTDIQGDAACLACYDIYGRLETVPPQCWQLTPELRWQSRGPWRVSHGCLWCCDAVRGMVQHNELRWMSEVDAAGKAYLTPSPPCTPPCKIRP